MIDEDKLNALELFGENEYLHKEIERLKSRLEEYQEYVEINHKEIERLNNIINELEKKIISICETCYENRETARIEKWIKELKGNDK